MIKLAIFLALVSVCSSEVAVISEPIPGQEYVFVQTSQSGARPISRKDKNVDAADRPFETAHKLPEALTYRQHEDVAVPVKAKAGKVKRQAAAPPGSIKIDALKLIEKYKENVKDIDAKDLIHKYRSEIEKEAKTSTTTKAPSTTRRSRSRSRTKKEAPVATTPNSILTTGAPPTPRSLKIRDTAAVKDDKVSAADNKRSRIQIKKGPNGQEYEYEYVYYYYDDDEEDGKAKATNSHDGPARNSISGRGRSTTAHPEPAANEVVPSTRTRGRGRQLTHEAPEEKIPEEKLPLNTRFPPRSRNINTTPASVEEEEPKTQRTRGRGRPQAQDNTADETQVSGRGRNRANVRRPSLELVDSASFNTHSSNDPAIEPYKEPKARGEKVKDGPTFPSELPEGPVRFLGATPNEKMDLQDLKSRLSDSEESSTDSESDGVTTEEVGTTEMNGMNKVALDLYAILQGTQKLSGENEEGITETDITTTESADTTEETTTEVVTTEEITTPTTTTTTTTTTTPAPTTTSTTPEPVTGRGKFRGRPGGNRFKSSPSSTTASPEPSSEKPKSRFGRPGFGSRPRPGAKATTEASETEITKEDAKPVNNARPSIGGRNRFSGRRTSAATTASPETSESTSAASRPGLSRPRPGSFNLRRRGGATSTTKEPAEESGDAAPSHDEPSTTAKPAIRGRVNGNLARPLRPGPRINLAARGRPGAPTSTTAAPEAGAEENTSEESQAEGEEKTEAAPAPAGKGPLNNLRNRPRLTVTPASRPKQAASSPVQVRRTNPLLRKKPVVNAEPSEAPTEPAAEAATEVAAEEEAPSEAPSSTTEEPRGLNKLLAGRRRLVRPAVNH